MRPLTGRGGRKDPAPSRFAFRVKRLWRRPSFRRGVTIYLPVATSILAIAWAAAQPQIRADVAELVASARDRIAERPEFAVRVIEVRGAGGALSPAVKASVQAALEPWRGASSLATDAAQIRAALHGVGWVRSADVRLSAPETLIVTVRQRKPAAVWRHDGALTLIDAEGAAIAPLAARADYPDLPLVAGEGADLAVGEALSVIAAAAGVAPRLRGLVRVGDRRWDAVFHEAPRVMLPAAGAADAMGYLAALQSGEHVLDRDLTAIDLRIEGRPTLRLGPMAHEALEEKRKPKKGGKDA